MSREVFYERLKSTLYFGSLPQWQRDPIEALLNEGGRRERSLQDCAYVLATAHHESGRFKHREEIGRGEGHAYGEPVYLYRNRKVAFYGRSWPQHTWLGNYAKLSVAATLAFQRPIDFVNNPDLLVGDLPLEAWAMWEGMVSGLWTGKNLADYIRPGAVDYVQARRIVNGTDRADEIAAYAAEFEAALTLITEEPDACPRSDCPMRSA